jgi:hypothetical protein
MIKITEIFPNPEGQDGDKEWVELTNFSSKPINLQNYILDDEEGGSKPYTIPHLILEPNKPTLLRKSQTNLNLNNDGDTVRLFEPTQSTPIQELTYGKTTQGLSYSLATILSQNSTNKTWTWTTPTPTQTNQTFYNFSGTIATIPKIEEDFQFTFQPENSQNPSSNPLNKPLPAQNQSEKTPPLTIIFTEETLDFETAATTLTPGTPIQILTSKISNSNFQLIDYKITSVEANTTPITSTKVSATIKYPSPLPALTILLLITTLIITLKLKKKFFKT